MIELNNLGNSRSQWNDVSFRGCRQRLCNIWVAYISEKGINQAANVTIFFRNLLLLDFSVSETHPNVTAGLNMSRSGHPSEIWVCSRLAGLAPVWGCRLGQVRSGIDVLKWGSANSGVLRARLCHCSQIHYPDCRSFLFVGQMYPKLPKIAQNCLKLPENVWEFPSKLPKLPESCLKRPNSLHKKGWVFAHLTYIWFELPLPFVFFYSRVRECQIMSGKPRVRLSCTVGLPSRRPFLIVFRRGILSVDLVDKEYGLGPSWRALAKGQTVLQEPPAKQYSWICLGTPPTSYRSQKLPRLEKSKKSLRRSLRGVSEGSRPAPQKESKMSLRSQKTGDFWLTESPGDSFLTLFGASAGTPRRLPRRLFFDFSSRGSFWLL